MSIWDWFTCNRVNNSNTRLSNKRTAPKQDKQTPKKPHVLIGINVKAGNNKPQILINNTSVNFMFSSRKAAD